MIWSRLKNIKCPKCNTELQTHHDYFSCLNQKCTFKIQKNRFNAIVESLYQGKTPSVEEDNFHKLQNL